MTKKKKRGRLRAQRQLGHLEIPLDQAATEENSDKRKEAEETMIEKKGESRKG